MTQGRGREKLEKQVVEGELAIHQGYDEVSKCGNVKTRSPGGQSGRF